MFESAAKFQSHNARRKPEWRFERIQQLLDNPKSAKSGQDDHYVRTGRSFLAKWRKAQSDAQRERLFDANPGLYYAYRLYDGAADDPIPTLILETRVLAGISEEAIAKGLTTLPETVTWYERLFFDVRPYLKNQDWVISQVIAPALAKTFAVSDASRRSAPSGPRFLDASVKFLAYFGGPLVADALIWGVQPIPPPDSPERLNAWMDKQWANLVKRRGQQAALNIEVNRFNIMDLLRLYSELIEQGRADEEAARDFSYWESAIRDVLSAIPLTINDVSRSTENEVPWEERRLTDASVGQLPRPERLETRHHEASSGDVPGRSSPADGA